MNKVLRIMAMQNLQKKLAVYEEQEQAMKKYAIENPAEYRKIMNIPFLASGPAFVSVIDRLRYE